MRLDITSGSSSDESSDGSRISSPSSPCSRFLLMENSTLRSCFLSLSASFSREAALSSSFRANSAAFLASMRALVGNFFFRSAIKAATSLILNQGNVVNKNIVGSIKDGMTHLRVSWPISSVRVFSSPSSSSVSESTPGVRPNVLVFLFFFLPTEGDSDLSGFEELSTLLLDGFGGRVLSLAP